MHCPCCHYKISLWGSLGIENPFGYRCRRCRTALTLSQLGRTLNRVVLLMILLALLVREWVRGPGPSSRPAFYIDMGMAMLAGLCGQYLFWRFGDLSVKEDRD